MGIWDSLNNVVAPVGLGKKKKGSGASVDNVMNQMTAIAQDLMKAPVAAELPSRNDIITKVLEDQLAVIEKRKNALGGSGGLDASANVASSTLFGV